MEKKKKERGNNSLPLLKPFFFYIIFKSLKETKETRHLNSLNLCARDSSILNANGKIVLFVLDITF